MRGIVVLPVFIRWVLIAAIGLLVISCGGGSGGVSSGVDTATVDNTPVDNALAQEVVDEAGGAVTVASMGSPIDGLTIEIPAGAVPDGEQYVFSVGVQAEAAQVVDRQRESAYLGFEALRQGDTGMHPFWGSIIQVLDQGTPLTPVIQLGPAGAEFDPPLTLRIPIEPLSIDSDLSDEDDDLLKNVSVLIGEFDAGTFEGQPLLDHYVDTDTAELVVTVPHFSSVMSSAQGFFSALRSIGSTLLTAGDAALNGSYRLWQRYRRDIVPVDDHLSNMARNIVCSGIEPKVDYTRMPNPIRLLQFLASPQAPAENQTDQEAIGEWEARGVMIGQETQLEDWLIAQPPQSVSVDDLFGQCYTRTDGDVMRALLLCHNVLRGWDGLNRRLSGNRSVGIQGAMKDLTGGNRAELDEIGDRYHIFGMAAFALNARLQSNHANLGGRAIGLLLPDDEETVGLAIAFEECVISGDCLSDEIEYAFDMQGADLGAEFADHVLAGLSRDGNAAEAQDVSYIAEHFAIDEYSCLTVDVVGDTEVTIEDFVNLTASASTTAGTAGYEWTLDGNVIETGPQLFRQFEEPGTYTLGVTATDDNLVKGFTTVQVTVLPPPSPDPFRLYHITNYSGAGYITIAAESALTTPPLLSGFPGGGISSTLEAEWEYLNDDVFNTRDEAAASLCGELTCFYRPVLASFIQKAVSSYGNVSLDTVFVRNCPTVGTDCP